jgi:hypothetical protein
LRVGEITKDTQLPHNCELREQRFDETEVEGGTTVVLLDASKAPEWVDGQGPADYMSWFGLDPTAEGLLIWDVYDAVLTPGDVILMATWKTHSDAELFEKALQLKTGCRLRQVRVIRHYSMTDRREAPQFYAAV